jgi:hypothetical protein
LDFEAGRNVSAKGRRENGLSAALELDSGTILGILNASTVARKSSTRADAKLSGIS